MSINKKTSIDIGYRKKSVQEIIRVNCARKKCAREKMPIRKNAYAEKSPPGKIPTRKNALFISVTQNKI